MTLHRTPDAAWRFLATRLAESQNFPIELSHLWPPAFSLPEPRIAFSLPEPRIAFSLPEPRIAFSLPEPGIAISFPEPRIAPPKISPSVQQAKLARSCSVSIPAAQRWFSLRRAIQQVFQPLPRLPVLLIA